MSSNISNNYAITSYSTNLSERFKSVTSVGTAASASVEVTANFSSFLDGESIEFTDTAGTTKTYFFDDDNTDGATGTVSGSYVIVQINGLSAAEDFAEQLENAIESSNGHNGTLLVTRSGAPASTLNITQSVDGASGETDITVSSGGLFTINGGGDSKFLGGVDGGTTSGSLDVAPFRIVNKGATTIRFQSTSNHYQTFIGEEKL